MNDFWTAEVAGLYTIESGEVSADPALRTYDRDWCNVVDVPPDYLRGLIPDPDGTIRLIELPVASADSEDP